MCTDEIATLYLDLMKKTLTHSLWVERTRSIDPLTMPHSVKRIAVEFLVGICKLFGIRIVREITPDPERRALGEDWPEYAHTMIGLKRLNNIEYCIKKLISDNIPGDLIETGVWRGGAVIFMRAILKAYAVTDKIVWVADSFCGLPEPDSIAYPADKGDICYQRDFTSVSIEDVRSNFRSYNLFDDQVRFLQGWFKDTLPNAPISQLALLRLDGDMYQSTWDSLNSLYPRLALGGFVIIDDFAAEPCKRAVIDYRQRNNITEVIETIDNWSVFWRRT